MTRNEVVEYLEQQVLPQQKTMVKFQREQLTKYEDAMQVTEDTLRALEAHEADVPIVEPVRAPRQPAQAPEPPSPPTA